jgi:hypothetical protein
MHWALNTAEKRLLWIVQANRLDPGAYFDVGLYELAHDLGRATVQWRKAADDMKRMHEA